MVIVVIFFELGYPLQAVGIHLLFFPVLVIGAPNLGERVGDII